MISSIYRNRKGWAIAYFVGLFMIVLCNPFRVHHQIPDKYRLRLHPIVDSVKDIQTYHGNPFIHWFNFLGNIFGNIIIFLPFSFVAMLVWRMNSIARIVLLAFLLSCSIETIQFYAKLGVADVDDILLNTTGAFIGYYLCRYFMSRYNYIMNP
jgi:glycopeptide antibiotics resistance protein